MQTPARHHIYGEVYALLLTAVLCLICFCGGQCLAFGTGELGAKVFGKVLFVFQVVPGLSTGVLADDGQNAGDVLANNADLGQFGCGTAGYFGNAKGGHFCFQLFQLLQKLCFVLRTKFVSLNLGHDDNCFKNYLEYRKGWQGNKQ